MGSEAEGMRLQGGGVCGDVRVESEPTVAPEVSVQTAVAKRPVGIERILRAFLARRRSVGWDEELLSGEKHAVRVAMLRNERDKLVDPEVLVTQPSPRVRGAFLSSRRFSLPKMTSG